jgi:hypothetical protein
MANLVPRHGGGRFKILLIMRSAALGGGPAELAGMDGEAFQFGAVML